jgi:hypothetical protein
VKLQWCISQVNSNVLALKFTNDVTEYVTNVGIT